MQIQVLWKADITREDNYRVVPCYRGQELEPKLLEKALDKFSQEEIVEVLIDQEGGLVTYAAVRMQTADRSSREQAGVRLFQRLEERKITQCTLDLTKFGKEGLDLLMGCLLATSQSKGSLHEILVVLPGGQELVKRMLATWSGVSLARKMTAAPPNILYPTAYAKKVREVLEPLGVSVTVLLKEEMEELGMHAMLAAGQGGGHPPCVILLEWGPKEQDPIAFVGKGVCFDSGGLCLKSSMQQRVMKWDKAGAGVIAGLFQTLALTKFSLHVVGILGMIENMPDGKAARPGDVVDTLAGVTVEIIDTDAEGRLVLADCLAYAEKYLHPKVLIDLGTLTIETRASLGEAFAGLYTEDEQLAHALSVAGNRTGDELWRLPMGSYFAKQITSHVADIKNSGLDLCGENGAAAEFLKRFVKIKHWAHLDIAGVSWLDQRVTGFGVRLLEEWLLSYCV
ncbi:MAG: leucyl aminopeptidase family protein [Chlamydiae bacterium]|nr:leucyl aminopeptidase family protein [Chlamydiota bacterium]